jgi:putative DNA primase/helicase
MTTARALEAEWKDKEEWLVTRRWRGAWYSHTGTHWEDVDEEDLGNRVFLRVENARYTKMVMNRGVPVPTAVDWAPTPAKVTGVTRALMSVLETSRALDMPAWLDGSGRSAALIACRNELLDPVTGETHGHSPAYLNAYSLAFDHDPEARCPALDGWLAERFNGDEATIALLQEWTGYVLSNRTDLQKMMVLIGPKRSGKGTYAYVLTQLLGAMNVVGPTIHGFVQDFGMQSLIGKPLAIFDDVRLGDSRSNDMETAVERLLSITGEGTLDVNRKNRAVWTGVLPTRLMMMSNEPPEFKDAAGALPYRMLTVVYPRSFAGREDLTLKQRLTAELPGVLNWALAGLQRLSSRGGVFTEPGTSQELIQELQDSSNDTRAFVRERCRLGEGLMVPVDDLYLAWSIPRGGFKDDAAQKQRFGKLLRAAFPDVKKMLKTPADGSGRRYHYVGIELVNDVSAFIHQRH